MADENYGVGPTFPASVGKSPAPLSGADLRAACETYLRERKWSPCPPLRLGMGMWEENEGQVVLTFCEALDVQWERDGIDGAT